MKANPSPRYRFIQHRSDARRRRIEFLMTFEEWWSVWEASGHWRDRGRKRGQFCMARPGDEGPYAIGNVKIIPFGENVREAQIGNHHTLGVKLSQEFREVMRRRMTGNRNAVGTKHTEAWKAAKSAAMMGNRHAARRST